MKVTNISPPETIVNAIGQTLRITKVLAFDSTSSIRNNFYHNLTELPQNTKTYNISYLQIPNYHSKKFLKTTERTKTEIYEVTKINTPEDFVNNESNIDNKKVISVDQKSLSKTFHCPDCNKEVTPDHDDLVDCLCGLMAAKE